MDGTSKQQQKKVAPKMVYLQMPQDKASVGGGKTSPRQLAPAGATTTFFRATPVPNQPPAATHTHITASDCRQPVPTSITFHACRAAASPKLLPALVSPHGPGAVNPQHPGNMKARQRTTVTPIIRVTTPPVSPASRVVAPTGTPVICVTTPPMSPVATRVASDTSVMSTIRVTVPTRVAACTSLAGSVAQKQFTGTIRTSTARLSSPVINTGHKPAAIMSNLSTLARQKSASGCIVSTGSTSLNLSSSNTCPKIVTNTSPTAPGGTVLQKNTPIISSTSILQKDMTVLCNTSICTPITVTSVVRLTQSGGAENTICGSPNTSGLNISAPMNRGLLAGTLMGGRVVNVATGVSTSHGTNPGSSLDTCIGTGLNTSTGTSVATDIDTSLSPSLSSGLGMGLATTPVILHTPRPSATIAVAGAQGSVGGAVSARPIITLPRSQMVSGKINTGNTVLTTTTTTTTTAATITATTITTTTTNAATTGSNVTTTTISIPTTPTAAIGATTSIPSVKTTHTATVVAAMATFKTSQTLRGPITLVAGAAAAAQPPIHGCVPTTVIAATAGAEVSSLGPHMLGTGKVTAVRGIASATATLTVAARALEVPSFSHVGVGVGKTAGSMRSKKSLVPVSTNPSAIAKTLVTLPCGTPGSTKTIVKVPSDLLGSRGTPDLATNTSLTVFTGTGKLTTVVGGSLQSRGPLMSGQNTPTSTTTLVQPHQSVAVLNTSTKGNKHNVTLTIPTIPTIQNKSIIPMITKPVVSMASAIATAVVSSPPASPVAATPQRPPTLHHASSSSTSSQPQRINLRITNGQILCQSEVTQFVKPPFSASHINASTLSSDGITFIPVTSKNVNNSTGNVHTTTHSGTSNTSTTKSDHMTGGTISAVCNLLTNSPVTSLLSNDHNLNDGGSDEILISDRIGVTEVKSPDKRCVWQRDERGSLDIKRGPDSVNTCTAKPINVNNLTPEESAGISKTPLILNLPQMSSISRLNDGCSKTKDLSGLTKTGTDILQIDSDDNLYKSEIPSENERSCNVPTTKLTCVKNNLSDIPSEDTSENKVRLTDDQVQTVDTFSEDAKITNLCSLLEKDSQELDVLNKVNTILNEGISQKRCDLLGEAMQELLETKDLFVEKNCHGESLQCEEVIDDLLSNEHSPSKPEGIKFTDVLQWEKDGLGELQGTKLKFRLNEFNAIELIGMQTDDSSHLSQKENLSNKFHNTIPENRSLQAIDTNSSVPSSPAKERGAERRKQNFKELLAECGRNMEEFSETLRSGSQSSMVRILEEEVQRSGGDSDASSTLKSSMLESSLAGLEAASEVKDNIAGAEGVFVNCVSCGSSFARRGDFVMDGGCCSAACLQKEQGMDEFIEKANELGQDLHHISKKCKLSSDYREDKENKCSGEEFVDGRPLVVCKEQLNEGDRSPGKSQRLPWQDHRLQFSWVKYLEHCNKTMGYGKAAPLKLWPEPFPTTRNLFKPAMRLEGIDPQHQSMFCVMTVVDMMGHRVKLHFDGYSDVFDFWTNADSNNLFAVGWCEKNCRQLSSPPGTVRFTWKAYLEHCKAIAAPRQAFSTRNTSIVAQAFNIRQGMKLEAEDRKNNWVCVASVKDVMQNRLLIHFDGWDSAYDSWMDVDSPYIHPVGWCSENNIPLYPPKDYPNAETFNWYEYLQHTSTVAVPARSLRMRPPRDFKKHMKVAVVDRRNPMLIRVATVIDVMGYQIKINFDGWDEIYDHWVDDDSPDVHPPSWCSKTGHPLQPPLTEEDRKQSFSGCEVPGCKGYGHIKGPIYTTHHTAFGCPYSVQNMNKDPDFLIPDRIQPITETKKRKFSNKVLLDLGGDLAEDEDSLKKRVRKRRRFFDEICAPETNKAKLPKVTSGEDCKFSNNGLESYSIQRNSRELSGQDSFNAIPRCSREPSDLSNKDSANGGKEGKNNNNEEELTLEAMVHQSIFNPGYHPCPVAPPPHSWRQMKHLFAPLGDVDREIVMTWTPAQVVSSLRTVPGCAGVPAEVLLAEEVDGAALLDLTQHDLVTRLSFRLGPALKIMAFLRSLRPRHHH